MVNNEYFYVFGTAFEKEGIIKDRVTAGEKRIPMEHQPEQLVLCHFQRILGSSLVDLWLGSSTFTVAAQLQSLVGEPTCHRLHDVSKTRKEVSLLLVLPVVM